MGAAPPALAGFLRPPGASEVIVAAGLSSFSRRFDARGRLARSGAFSKMGLDVHASHGLNERVGLIANVAIDRLERSDKGFAPAQSWHVLAGPRLVLWRGEATVLSAQALAGFGRDDSARGAALGAMADARLLLGHGFRWGDWPAFGEVQAGYRFAAPGARDEIRVDATIGVSPHPDWQLLLQAFGAYAPARAGGEAASGRLKLQAAVIRQLGPQWRAQLSLFTTPLGLNAAAESGGALALWRQF
jgi:hypothetical protein